MSSKIGKSQGVWLKAIQKRLNMTTSMLQSMKEIKMIGLSVTLSSLIQKVRLEEIATSIPFRRLLSISIVICKY